MIIPLARVVSLVEDGAARACGEIQIGDILMAIDDTQVELLPMSYVRPLLLGHVGSRVRRRRRRRRS